MQVITRTPNVDAQLFPWLAHHIAKGPDPAVDAYWCTNMPTSASRCETRIVKYRANHRSSVWLLGLYLLVKPNREVAHFLWRWVTSLPSQLFDCQRLESCRDRSKGGEKKTTSLPPTPPWSQFHWTTCHPVRPNHAIQASPWANKDLFQARPQWDGAEQKQSVPLGCSLVLSAAPLALPAAQADSAV